MHPDPKTADGRQPRGHRKQRPLVRYWARMRKGGFDPLHGLDAGTWFNHWHTHPDWEGKGDRGQADLQASADLLYLLLQEAESLVRHRGGAVQCWATFVPAQSDQSGVFLHSANPHSALPFDVFAEVSWDAAVPAELERVVVRARHEVGRVEYDGVVSFVVRRRAAGVTGPTAVE